LLLIAAAVLGLVAPAAASSVGDELDFVLTSDHCTGTCGPGGTVFGTVNVTQSAVDSLTFVVALNNGSSLINTGFPVTVGFSLTGIGSVTYTGLTAGFSIAGGTNPQANGALHVDGFGDVGFGVLWDLQGGCCGTTGGLSFTITAPGLSLANLLEPFVADILSGLNGNTGLVDASQPGTPRTVGVPGPVLGAGLPGLLSGLGLWFLNRMRRRRSVA